MKTELQVSTTFKSEVTKLIKADTVATKALEDVQTKGKNLVSVLIDEVITLSKKVEVNPNSKQTPKEYKQTMAFKVLKAYNDNSRYQECLTIAKGMIVNKYDAGNYRDATINEMKQLVELKPSKASVKKDFKEALRVAKKAKEATKVTKAQTALKADTKLKEIVSELSSEQLLTLKAYLNTLKATK